MVSYWNFTFEFGYWRCHVHVLHSTPFVLVQGAVLKSRTRRRLLKESSAVCLRCRFQFSFRDLLLEVPHSSLAVLAGCCRDQFLVLPLLNFSLEIFYPDLKCLELRTQCTYQHSGTLRINKYSCMYYTQVTRSLFQTLGSWLQQRTTWQLQDRPL